MADSQEHLKALEEFIDEFLKARRQFVLMMGAAVLIGAVIFHTLSGNERSQLIALFAAVIPIIPIYKHQTKRLKTLTKTDALPRLCDMAGLSYFGNNPSQSYRADRMVHKQALSPGSVILDHSVMGRFGEQEVFLDEIRVATKTNKKTRNTFSGLIFTTPMAKEDQSMLIRSAKPELVRGIAEAFGGNRPMANRREQTIPMGDGTDLAVFFEDEVLDEERVSWVVSNIAETHKVVPDGAVRAILMDGDRLSIAISTNRSRFYIPIMGGNKATLSRDLERIVGELSLPADLYKIWGRRD